MAGRLYLSPAEWRAVPGNIPSLDGLRGCSILIVLSGHMLLPDGLMGISALGLKLFFVLSGFLITRLLLAEKRKHGDISLKNFYIRRVLRLYPILVIYVLVTAAVLMIRGQYVPPIEAASVFFYFVNYLVIYYDHIGLSFTLPIGMFWSLSVEEHFYLFAPLALVLMGGNARRMLGLAIFICIASLGLRLLYAYEDPAIVNTLELYWRSETRFDSIAYGVILACLPELDRGRRLIERMTTRPVFILSIAFLLGTFAFRDAYFQNTWRFTLQGLALIPIFASVIFAEPVPFFNRILNTPVLVWVGALSYSLYVWHGAVVLFFYGWIETLPYAAIKMIDTVLSVVFALLSFYMLERPILSLRKRFGHRTLPKEEGSFAATAEPKTRSAAGVS